MIFHGLPRRVAAAVISMAFFTSGLTVVAPPAVASTPIGPEYSPESGPEVRDVFNNGDEVIIEPLNELGDGVRCANNPAWPDAITVEETTCRIHIQPSVDKTQDSLSDNSTGEWTLRPIQTQNGGPILDTREEHQKAAFIHVYATKADKYEPQVDELIIIGGAADREWSMKGFQDNTEATCTFLYGSSETNSFEIETFQLAKKPGTDCTFTVSGPAPFVGDDDQISTVPIKVKYSDNSFDKIEVPVRIKPTYSIDNKIDGRGANGWSFRIPGLRYNYPEAIERCDLDEKEKNFPWISAAWDGEKCMITAIPGADVEKGSYNYYVKMIGKNGKRSTWLRDAATVSEKLADRVHPNIVWDRDGYEFEVGGENPPFFESKVTNPPFESCELSNPTVVPWLSVSMGENTCHLVVNEEHLVPENSRNEISVTLTFSDGSKLITHPTIHFVHKVRIVVGVNVDAAADEGVYSAPEKMQFAFAGPEQPFTTREEVSFTNAPQGAVKQFDGAAATTEQNLTDLAEFADSDDDGYLTFPYGESVFLAWKNIHLPETDHFVLTDEGTAWELVDPKNNDDFFMELPSHDRDGKAKYTRKVLQVWRALDAISGQDPSETKKTTVPRGEKSGTDFSVNDGNSVESCTVSPADASDQWISGAWDSVVKKCIVSANPPAGPSVELGDHDYTVTITDKFGKKSTRNGIVTVTDKPKKPAGPGTWVHSDIDTTSGPGVKEYKDSFDVKKTDNRIPAPRIVPQDATCKAGDGVPTGITVNSDCSLSVDGTKFSVDGGVVTVPVIVVDKDGSEGKMTGFLHPFDGTGSGTNNAGAVIAFVIGMGGLLAASIGIFAMLAKHCPFFRSLTAPWSGQ